MSQNSLLIILGGLWNLIATFYLALAVTSQKFGAEAILALALFLSTCFLFGSDLLGSPKVRWLGSLTHFLAPICWFYWFASIEITVSIWFVLVLLSAMGSGIALLGLHLETHQPSLGYDNEAFMEFVEKQRRQAGRAVSQISSRESGSYRAVMAYDSGGFSLPQL